MFVVVGGVSKFLGLLCVSGCATPAPWWQLCGVGGWVGGGPPPMPWGLGNLGPPLPSLGLWWTLCRRSTERVWAIPNPPDWISNSGVQGDSQVVCYVHFCI